MLKKLSIIVAVCAISLLFVVTVSADTVSLGTVTADSLNVRSGPSTDHSSLGLISNGQEVVILGTENNWYKILNGSTHAFVSSDYISVTATGVQKDLSAMGYVPSGPTVSLGTVTADSLYVRSAPSTDSSSLGFVSSGQEVVIHSTEGNWHKISYNNSTAYVCADYVTVTATGVLQSSAPAGKVPASTGYIPSYTGSSVPGEQLVELAKQYIGTPYVYGGMSPAGFDCSGLVMYCYNLMGVSINRVAADQALNGYEVSVSDMRPGDILCFSSSVGGSYIGHSGIYVGNGYFIHSPRTGYNVEIVALDATSYSKRIKNVRRIF